MLRLDRHVPTPGVPEFNRRFGWLIAFVALMFFILVGRLWQLQIIRGERYFQSSTNNFVKEKWLPAVRGRILDRRGTVLVDNRPAYNLYITPRFFTADAEQRLVRLFGLGETETEELHAKVQAARAKDKNHAALIFEDIDRDRVALVEQSAAELPGVDIDDVPHRSYLYGPLAAHILGYMNQISDEELEAKRADGYEDGDYIGRYGIEKQWENWLRGKMGVERYVVDAKGQRKSDKESEDLLSGVERFRAPVPGHNVYLTIDADLQRVAERALRNYPAAGIAVVEVSTGRVLALVSKPAFDPNVMTGHLTRAEEAQMEANPYKPFIDKTLRQHYYPGSTFKFVTAIAGLEDKYVTPTDRIVCPGYYEFGGRPFHCTKAHGSVSLYEALAQSCNVYFWRLADKVGMDQIADIATQFGFGVSTGINLNGDVPGHVPMKAWYEKHGGFRPGYTLNTAIGQGDMQVTVLQLALAYAALANGGDLWVPQIVDRVESASGKVTAEYPPTRRRHIDLPDNVRLPIMHGLYGVVNDPKGTAYSSRPAGSITVAGKTGTAQVRKLQKQAEGKWDPGGDHAWFAGYAPAEKPEIAIVVLIEHGGHGGHVAAPVAEEIIQAYFENIKPGLATPNVAAVSSDDHPGEPPSDELPGDDVLDEGPTLDDDGDPRPLPDDTPTLPAPVDDGATPTEATP